MPAFVTTIDNQPHTWQVQINLGHVAAIQQQYPDFRLERVLLSGASEFERLATDATLLAWVLEVLLGDQLRLRGVTVQQLLGSISGPVIDEIIKALIEAIGFFSPTRQGRERARQIVELLTALQQADQATSTAETSTAETNSGTSSGTAPPSPESSPGGSA